MLLSPLILVGTDLTGFSALIWPLSNMQCAGFLFGICPCLASTTHSHVFLLTFCLLVLGQLLFLYSSAELARCIPWSSPPFFLPGWSSPIACKLTMPISYCRGTNTSSPVSDGEHACLACASVAGWSSSVPSPLFWGPTLQAWFSHGKSQNSSQR